MSIDYIQNCQRRAGELNFAMMCSPDGGLGCYVSHQWAQIQTRFASAVAITWSSDRADALFKETTGVFYPLITPESRESIDRIVAFVAEHKIDLVCAQIANRVRVYDGYFCELFSRLRSLGIAVVAVLHEVFPLYSNTFEMSRLQALYAQLDGVIVSSERERGRLQQFQLRSPENVRVCPHPVYTQLNRQRFDKQAARAFLGLPRQARIVAQFGMARVEKGYTLMAEAFNTIRETIPDALFLCHVNDDHAHFSNWEEEFARLQSLLGDQTRLLQGELSSEETEALFVACDLVVLPYLRGVQSGVYNAALAFSRPTLVSSSLASEMALALPDEQIFACADRDDLSTRLSYLLKLDHQQLVSLGEKHIEAAIGSWSGIVDSLASISENCTTRQPIPAGATHCR